MNRYFLSTRAFSFIATLIALTLAAGCGGDDGGSEATASDGQIVVQTGSLSKPEFIKQANTLCSEAEKRFFEKVRAKSEKAANGQSTVPRKTQYDIYASVVHDLYTDMAHQIAELGAPADYKKQVSKFVNSIPPEISNLDAHPIQAFADGTPLSETFTLARAYGWAGCVEALS